MHHITTVRRGPVLLATTALYPYSAYWLHPQEVITAKRECILLEYQKFQILILNLALQTMVLYLGKVVNVERYEQSHGDRLGRLLEYALEVQAELHRWQKERDQIKHAIRKQQRQDTATLRHAAQQLETRIATQQSTLRSVLWKMPNWVDDPMPPSVSPTATVRSPAGPTVAAPTTVDDPVFCIGGYEVLTTNASHQQIVALTDVGCRFQAALERYMLHSVVRGMERWLQDHGGGRLQQWNVPNPGETLTPEEYHDVFGCGTAYCPACDTQCTTLAAPPWLTLLRRQARTGGVSYSDRQLPLIHVISTTTSTSPFTADRASSSRPRKQKQLPWHHRLASANTIEVLIITGSSFTHDIQPLVQALVYELLGSSVYPSLGSTSSKLSVEHIVDQLQPHEASRWQVRDLATQTVLAVLSNLRDYCSETALRIHHKEPCMVLHGTFCHAPGALDWMARTHTTTTAGGSVTVPPPLRLYYDENNNKRVPFQRTVRVGKGGRRVVVPIQKEPDDEFVHPTLDRIRAEATTAPSSFLPFYAT